MVSMADKSIYLYPKGKNGKLIADMIKLYYKNNNITFIDDSKAETSLELLSKEISSNDILLICSKKYKNELLKNINRLEIQNYLDGIDYFGEKINNLILEKKKKRKKPIGIVLSGLSVNRHLGNIDKKILNENLEVIYICNNLETLELNRNRISNHPSILADHDILKKINEISILVTTNGGYTHPSVISLDMRHSFCDILMFPYFHPTDHKEKLCEYMESVDYICMSCQQSYNAAISNLKNIKKKPKLIKTGSVSLDKYIQDYKNIENKATDNQVIIVALSDLVTSIEALRELLNNNFIVYFRPHPSFHVKAKELTEEFVHMENFILDTSKKLNVSLMAKSLTLITDYSSLGYTYPLSTLKPAIIYKLDISKNINGYGYFDNNIHLLVSKKDSLIQTIQNLQKNKSHHSTKILTYLNEKVFNVGCSAKYILDSIKKLTIQKVTDRDK